MKVNLNATDVDLKNVLELVEKEVYKQAMEMCKYNQSKAAKELGVSRNTFRTKLKQHFPNVYI